MLITACLVGTVAWYAVRAVVLGAWSPGLVRRAGAAAAA
ncbi:hypothetical protein H4W32_009016 [Actinophytocola algeriensis]|uniref:Uncharacterized protein n=1 Tax=Actinophytocola algeriensis TaxID=1768010 RepID=A0A7W7QF96_9PSEU|nr:hypothetical protein [Actinophytocola algeriensis]MBE1480974.1 hypothetical protein [Actinophytocola algeriensis]